MRKRTQQHSAYKGRPSGKVPPAAGGGKACCLPAASGEEKGKAPRPLTPAGFLFAFSVGSSLFTFPVCGKTRKGAFAAVVQYPYDPTEVITNGKDER